MAFLRRESAEEKAARETRDEAMRVDRARRRDEDAFRRSPAGNARSSCERGDAIFQVHLDLGKAGTGAGRAGDPRGTHDARKISEILNSIVAEGWDLHGFSTALVHESAVSRDKPGISGREVVVQGRLIGVYVFTRRPDPVPQPS